MHLIYLDANNLYGWAMGQYLPVKDFKFLKKDEIQRQFPNFTINVADDADTGYSISNIQMTQLSSIST